MEGRYGRQCPAPTSLWPLTKMAACAPTSLPCRLFPIPSPSHHHNCSVSSHIPPMSFHISTSIPLPTMAACFPTCPVPHSLPYPFPISPHHNHSMSSQLVSPTSLHPPSLTTKAAYPTNCCLTSLPPSLCPPNKFRWMPQASQQGGFSPLVTLFGSPTTSFQIMRCVHLEVKTEAKTILWMKIPPISL